MTGVAVPLVGSSSSGLRRLAWTLLVCAALGFCAFGGWTYWYARSGGSSLGQQRDDVVAAAREEIATLNTVDAGDLDFSVQHWISASTGTFHDGMVATSAQTKAQLAAAGSSAVGTVTDVAVTQLDLGAGTASVIATVHVAVTSKSGVQSAKRQRFDATLSHTPTGWKLTALTSVAAP